MYIMPKRFCKYESVEARIELILQESESYIVAQELKK